MNLRGETAGEHLRRIAPAERVQVGQLLRLLTPCISNLDPRKQGCSARRADLLCPVVMREKEMPPAYGPALITCSAGVVTTKTALVARPRVGLRARRGPLV